MLPWRFSTFLAVSGQPKVQQDIDRLDDYGREYLRSQVRHLAGTPQHGWHEPQAKKLKGVEGLYEIRFKAARKQTRAIGTFLPDSDEFTILIIADHKDNVYSPPDAIQTAAKRRRELHADRTRCAPLQIDGEVLPPVDAA